MNWKTARREAWSRPALLTTAAIFLLPLAIAAQDEAGELALEWPVELNPEKGTIVIYQPQLESFEGDRLASRAAISVTETGKTEPVFGAIWIDARVSTDFETRTVELEEVKVTAAKFPEIDDEAKIKELTNYLEQEIPQWDMEMSLDRLLASMEVVESGREVSENLNNEPPEIIVVNSPTVLVMIDGDPILADFEGADIEYVANTPFMILKDKKSFYMKGGDYWYTAKDISGDWQVTSDLPQTVAEIAKQVAEEEKKLAEEEKKAAEETETEPAPADSTESGEPVIPTVLVRTKPAELIQIDGEPDFASVEGTSLLYLSNSESDVIMNIDSQQYYVLLAGRWYVSKSLTAGPWAFVEPSQVPPAFADIPAGSDMASVLASVAGTQEAKEAVLQNSIPQTATIDRKTATVEVTFDGDPTFELCGDSGIYYGINTPQAVFLINETKTYYCCDDAVWFVGKNPTGPWEVATELPAQFQDLPPDCPHYNVKYVYVYDSTPEVVYVGYTPAYYGSYVYGGCVVWGTGYYYHPWYGAYYYPRPFTYGFGVHYNPWTGWGFSYGMSYGWMSVGIRWGSPYRYGGWWGAGGYRYGYRHGYHHGYRHGYRHGARQGARVGYRAGYRAGQRNSYNNAYRNRSTGVRNTGTRGGAGNRAGVGGSPGSRPGVSTQPSTRQGGGAGKKTPKTSNQKNNVYADKSGNVHRQQGNDWQQRDKSGGWSSSGGTSKDRSAKSGSTTQQNLNRESSARQRGNQQTQSYNSSSRSRSGGGGRYGGGGRGGGGRR